MGSRRSRHNKGRKPFYKDHGATAAQILSHKRYAGAWLDARLNWRGEDLFALDVLCEADADIEGAADALGRPPSNLAHKARDMGFTLPREWVRIITPKRAKIPRKFEPNVALNYPYIQKARPEHADIVAINAMIPATVPDHMRSDMCQEIMLAILEGRTTLEKLKARRRDAVYFIRKFYKDNFEDSGNALSFNTAGQDQEEEMAARAIERREWHYGQLAERHRHIEAFGRATTGAIQIEACWNDQVGRVRFDLQKAGMFLTQEEVEDIMSSDSYQGIEDFS